METILLSAAKNDVGSCDDTINDVVADFNGDLEQRELMRNLALPKNIITGYEITLNTLRGESVRVLLCLSTSVNAVIVCCSCYISYTSVLSFSVLHLVKTNLRTTMKQD